MYQRLKHCFLKFFSQSALKTLFFFALVGKPVFSEVKNVNSESVVRTPEISELRKKMDFLNEKINSLSKQKNNYKIQDVKTSDSFSEVKNVNSESVVRTPEISELRKKMDFLNEKINSLSEQKNNYKVQDVKKTDPPESVFTNQYSANKISYIYGDKRGSLPNLSEIQKVYINLSFQDDPLLISDLVKGRSENFQLTLKDLHALSEVPVQYLKSLGYEGVITFPSSVDIDPLTGEDLRKGENKTINLIIWASKIQKFDVNAKSVSHHEKLTERVNRTNEKYLGKRKGIHKHLLQRDIRFLNRWGNSSSRSAKVTLEPGSKPGQVKAVTELKKSDPSNFFFQSSNSGTPSTGQWLFNLSAISHQLSGTDDQLGISMGASNTFERQFVSTFYRRPILYPDLLEFGAGLGYSKYDASTFAVKQIDFEGENLGLDLFLKWNPLLTEGKSWQIGFDGGIRGENVKSSNSLYSDSANAYLLSPNIGIRLDINSDYLKTRTSLSLSGNILSVSSLDRSALGGVNAIDRYANLNFSYLESLYFGKWLSDSFPNLFGKWWTRQQILTKFHFLQGLSDKRLLPQNQFVLGGSGTVRGYPESPVAGDRGFFLSVEYRLPIIYNSHFDVSLNPFLDWGQTYINDPLFYEFDQNLLGAGIGLEFQLSMGLFARIDFAKPLNEVSTPSGTLEGSHSGDYRVHTLLRAEF